MIFVLVKYGFQVSVHHGANTGAGSKEEICNIYFVFKFIVSNINTVLI